MIVSRFINSKKNLLFSLVYFVASFIACIYINIAPNFIAFLLVKSIAY